MTLEALKNGNVFDDGIDMQTRNALVVVTEALSEKNAASFLELIERDPLKAATFAWKHVKVGS